MIRFLALAAAAATLLVACGGDDDPAPVACGALAGQAYGGATVLGATAVPAGDFQAPAQAGGLLPAQTLAAMPAFCRVVAQAKPSADSAIGIEAWIPSTWNGKYLQVGTLAYAGVYQYAAMAVALKRGYAIASTDTGHGFAAPDVASWAVGHPEKVVDWGWRAHKSTADFAKAAIQAHKAQAASRSYFVGASNGGREGFMLAQRHPEEFDGYLLDGPANAWSRMAAGWVNTTQAQFANAASTIPASKAAAIQAAALAQCDAADGLADGIVADPRACRFDPQPLLCAGAESNACLTAPQLASLARILDGARHPTTGARVFPGYEPYGVTAPDWAGYIWGPSFFGVLNSNGVLGNAWFGDFVRGTGAPLTFDFASVHFATDVAAAQTLKVGSETLAQVVDAAGTDFSGIRKRNARILLTTGWEDPVVPPRHVIEYYESVVNGPAFGGSLAAAREHFRLFMIPGGGHLAGAGAPGAAGVGNPFGQASTAADRKHDVLAALEAWVENGTAPETIVAARYVDDKPASGVRLTRPLCVYPGVPRYQGSGDPNAAASFRCVDAPRGAYPQ